MIPQRLIAIGDIHGCFVSLKKLIENKICIQKPDRLIFLGDYIDRGPNSKEVIDFIISLKEKGFDIITLIGNHERMLIDAFKEDSKIPLWLLNGGGETLDSFGLKATVGLPEIYWKFFIELEYFYCYRNYIFVHAGLNDKIIDPFEDKYHMIWTRNDNYSNPILKEKTIIHGHTPITSELCKAMIKQNSQVINLDTGCVYKEKKGYGILTALDIFSNTIYSA